MVCGQTPTEKVSAKALYPPFLGGSGGLAEPPAGAEVLRLGGGGAGIKRGVERGRRYSAGVERSNRYSMRGLGSIQRHYTYKLESAVSSAFWNHVPPEQKILREWERQSVR